MRFSLHLCCDSACISVAIQPASLLRQVASLAAPPIYILYITKNIRAVYAQQMLSWLLETLLTPTTTRLVMVGVGGGGGGGGGG